MTSVTIERGDQITTTWAPAGIRVEERRQAAQPYRGPYGTVWRAADANTWNAPVIMVTYEATSDPGGMSEAANGRMADFIAAVEAAAIITTVAGVFVPAAVLDVQASPITNGYAVSIRLAARRELVGTDAAILRMINGDPWELR